MRYRAGWEPSEGDDGPSCWFPYGLHLECLPHLSHVKMQHMGFNFYSPPSEKCFALAQEKTWFPDSILFAFFFFSFCSCLSFFALDLPTMKQAFQWWADLLVLALSLTFQSSPMTAQSLVVSKRDLLPQYSPLGVSGQADPSECW